MTPVRWVRSKLQRQLALAVGSLGLVVLSTMAWYAHGEARTQVISAVDDDLSRRSESLLALSEIGLDRLAVPDVDPAEVPLASRGLLDETAGVAFFDANGVSLFEAGGSIPAPMNQLSFSFGDAPEFETVLMEGSVHRVMTLPVDVENGGSAIVAQFSQDITSSVAALDAFGWRLLVTVVLGSAGVAVISWLTGAWLARPISDLTAAAQRVAGFSDTRPIEVDREDETGELARSFNSMLASLELSREQQRRIVADASHQLRTPLTSLRMRTELLLIDDQTDSRQVQLLRGSLDDVALLTELTADLVDLAAAITPEDEDLVDVDLRSFVADVLGPLESASGRELSLIGDTTRVPIRPVMVGHAVRNLVENALKYAPDGPIDVRVLRGSVEVHDSGLGIDERDSDVVFERFFRSPDARSRPGNGIGLAIVREVAVSHGGTTWVSKSPLGGAAVGLSLLNTHAADRPRRLQGALSFESGPSHLHR